MFYLRNFVGAQKRFKNVFRKRFLKTLYNICWECLLKTFFITFKFRQTNMFSKHWKYLFLLKISFGLLTRCHFIVQLLSLVSDRDWQNSCCFDNLFIYCRFVQQFYPWCVYHIHDITALYTVQNWFQIRIRCKTWTVLIHNYAQNVRPADHSYLKTVWNLTNQIAAGASAWWKSDNTWLIYWMHASQMFTCKLPARIK